MSSVNFYGTVARVKDLSGITAQTAGVENDTKLDELIQYWLEAVKSEIDTRLAQGEILQSDPQFKGISLLAERKVADLFILAQNYRNNPIIKIDDFVVKAFNSSVWTEGLSRDLKPYQRRRVSIFHSGTDVITEDEKEKLRWL